MCTVQESLQSGPFLKSIITVQHDWCYTVHWSRWKITYTRTSHWGAVLITEFWKSSWGFLAALQDGCERGRSVGVILNVAAHSGAECSTSIYNHQIWNKVVWFIIQTGGTFLNCSSMYYRIPQCTRGQMATTLKLLNTLTKEKWFLKK